MKVNDQNFREAISQGQYNGPTSGFRKGFVQANIVILPQTHADEFIRFCLKNPKPLPILYASEPGEFHLEKLSGHEDIRVSLPAYNVYENGKYIAGTENIHAWWRPDLVVIALGCSFSFDSALAEAGVRLDHLATGKNIAMYNTNIKLDSTRHFSGDMVVTLRQLTTQQAIEAIQISNRFPFAHGAPIHFGNPADIGIESIHSPDYGDPPCQQEDYQETLIPVFWACGVTAQRTLEQADIPFFITHKPGCMLVTDLFNERLILG